MAIGEQIWELLYKVAPMVPFTAPNTVRRNLDKAGGTLLDVGCGNGRTVKYITKGRDLLVIGVDIFAPVLKEAKNQGIHDDSVLGDVRALPFLTKSFDIVVCLSVIEHLQKEDGRRLIKVIEGIARRQVIILCPVGSAGVGIAADDEVNTYNVHKAGWLPAEFRSLGYKVRGHGIAYAFEWGGYRNLPIIFKLLVNAFVLVLPFSYFFPRLGDRMICIKSISS